MSQEQALTIRYLFLTMAPELRANLEAKVGHPLKAGDAILITLPTGENLLIDSGMPHTGDILTERLQELGVTKLEYVLNTHPHWDHLGGFLTLLPTIPVGLFFRSPLAHPESDHYKELVDLLEKHSINIVELVEGTSLKFGSVNFEVLNPPISQLPAPEKSVSTAEINNLSLVLRLSYKDFSLLFTGDLYEEQEKILVEKYGSKLETQILDVPHHGRATSSSEELITTVKPHVAIISHEDPSQPREGRYLEHGIPVVATGDHQEIVIKTNGETTVITAGDLTMEIP